MSSFVRRVSRSSVAISIETVRISFRVLWSWVASAASVAASETEESEDDWDDDDEWEGEDSDEWEGDEDDYDMLDTSEGS